MSKVKIKNDKFKKARGGHPRFLDISCSSCSSHLFFYQKDGPGILKRAYIDRIINNEIDINSNLNCPNCKKLLGMQMIYEKENRPAIRFFEGSVSKKLLKKINLIY